MKTFLEKHSKNITSTISCFDRVLFKGYLPLGWQESMERLMAENGLKIKDFKHFVTAQATRLKDHAKAYAENSARPYYHLTRPVRKEAFAQRIAEKDQVTEGLVCILAAVEACQSFKIAYGEGRPKIEPAR